MAAGTEVSEQQELIIDVGSSQMANVKSAILVSREDVQDRLRKEIEEALQQEKRERAEEAAELEKQQQGDREAEEASLRRQNRRRILGGLDVITHRIQGAAIRHKDPQLADTAAEVSYLTYLAGRDWEEAPNQETFNVYRERWKERVIEERKKQAVRAIAAQQRNQSSSSAAATGEAVAAAGRASTVLRTNRGSVAGQRVSFIQAPPTARTFREGEQQSKIKNPKGSVAPLLEAKRQKTE